MQEFLRAIATISVLVSAITCCDARPTPASIGSATMSADRTVTLRLRAEERGGILGEGVLVYRPGSRYYKEVLDHIGGLKPGQTKLVPPWP
jgi:hypothetical protein